MKKLLRAEYFIMLVGLMTMGSGLHLMSRLQFTGDQTAEFTALTGLAMGFSFVLLGAVTKVRSDLSDLKIRIDKLEAKKNSPER